MEDIGSPLEWQNDMQAGIDEIYRLRTALAASEARVEKARVVVEQMARFYTHGGGPLDFESAAATLKEITDD